MDLFVQYQLPADYWLTGRLQASGKKEGKDIVVYKSGRAAYEQKIFV